jgi:hypothetical protein
MNACLFIYVCIAWRACRTFFTCIQSIGAASLTFSTAARSNPMPSLQTSLSPSFHWFTSTRLALTYPGATWQFGTWCERSIPPPHTVWGQLLPLENNLFDFTGPRLERWWRSTLTLTPWRIEKTQMSMKCLLGLLLRWSTPTQTCERTSQSFPPWASTGLRVARAAASGSFPRMVGGPAALLRFKGAPITAQRHHAMGRATAQTVRHRSTSRQPRRPRSTSNHGAGFVPSVVRQSRKTRTDGWLAPVAATPILARRAALRSKSAGLATAQIASRCHGGFYAPIKNV